MEIYLKHPVHGTKIASLEAEAKADETRGWSRFDPYQKIAPSPNPIAVLKAEVRADNAPPKRGRPRKVN